MHLQSTFWRARKCFICSAKWTRKSHFSCGINALVMSSSPLAKMVTWTGKPSKWFTEWLKHSSWPPITKKSNRLNWWRCGVARTINVKVGSLWASSLVPVASSLLKQVEKKWLNNDFNRSKYLTDTPLLNKKWVRYVNYILSTLKFTAWWARANRYLSSNMSVFCRLEGGSWFERR